MVIYSQTSLKQPSIQWNVVKFPLFPVNLTSINHNFICIQSPLRIPNCLILLHSPILNGQICNVIFWQPRQYVNNAQILNPPTRVFKEK